MLKQANFLVLPTCESRLVEGSRALARARAAIRDWRTGLHDNMVITGGNLTKNKSGEICSDARVMANWILAQSGAPSSEQISIQEGGLTTLGNVRDIQQALLDLRPTPQESLWVGNLTIVTDRWQYRRFELYFRHNLRPFFGCLCNLEPDQRLTLLQIVLEDLLYLYAWLEPTGHGPLTRWLERHRFEKVSTG